MPAVEALIDRTVAACATALRQVIARRRGAEEHLRAVREAGRQLLGVQRSLGGRPGRNSVRRLTSFQAVLERATISRQTAYSWQRVAQVPQADFDRYLATTRETHQTSTIVDLLEFVRSAREDDTLAKRKDRTIRLVMSAAEYRAFKHRVDQLSAVYRTQTVTETVIALAAREHADYLRAQLRPHGSARVA